MNFSWGLCREPINKQGRLPGLPTDLLTVVILGLLAACGSMQLTADDELTDGLTIELSQQAAPGNSTSMSDADVSIAIDKLEKELENPVAPFTKDILYQLLVAEVAGYRGYRDLALQKYVQVAQETGDAGVAGRATRLAVYLERNDLALKTAAMWAQAEPDNVEAHRYTADLMLKAGNLEGAIQEMEAIKNLGGLANFEVFAYRASSLEQGQQQALLSVFTRMLDKYPDDEQLKFSKAILLEQTGDLQGALSLSNEMLSADSSHINVVILKVSILQQLGKNKESVKFLRGKVKKSPDNKRLRLIYARLLFEIGKLDLAKEQYLWVQNKAPEDGDILFALALISMEQKDDEASIKYLTSMIGRNERPGEAHFYLGSIAEKNNDALTALREYRQTGMGYEFLPAHSRIATILAGQGKLSQARDHLANVRENFPDSADQLLLVEAQILSDENLKEELFLFLDQALTEYPDHTDLLYFRAMTGERYGDLGILERDLRRIIEVDPDNAEAINALGYTLADRTDRHDEALELISKALEMNPDEAAFIDSMGWVQYRLSNYEEALVHLKRALSLFPNDEVAAHLAEVLWVAGKKREARAVFKKALKLKPDSVILKDAMERLIE